MMTPWDCRALALGAQTDRSSVGGPRLDELRGGASAEVRLKIAMMKVMCATAKVRPQNG